MLVTLEDAKTYLRVDFTDEDSVIEALLDSAEAMCVSVGRLSDEQWSKVDADATDSDTAELRRVRSLMRQSILYTLGYLYEHREEADVHDAQINVLRPILSAVREGTAL